MTPVHAETSLMPIRNRVAFAAIASLIVIAALFRFQNLDEPLGGYHAMNEAWYISVARNFSHTSLLKPTGYNGEEDTKLRALYVYAVYAAFKVFGDKPAVARGVSAASGLAAVLLIFLIGNSLAGFRAGATAALFLALSPVHILLSRNAQPESLMISLTLLSLFLYISSAGKVRNRNALLAFSGLAWGAAVFTKNSALLILPCLIVNELISTAGLKAAAKRLAVFLAPAAAALAPFIIHRAFNAPERTVSIYRQMALSMPDARGFKYLLSEALWAMSPGVSAIAAVFVFALLFTNIKKYFLPCSLAAVFCAQYMFQNVHSYYFLPASVFLSLVAALGVARMPQRPASIVAGAAAGICLIFALLIPPAIKVGFSYFRDAAAVIRSESHTGTIIASEQIFNNYGPVLAGYTAGFSIEVKEKLRADKLTGRITGIKTRPVFLLDFPAPGQKFDERFQTVVYHEMKGVRIGRRIFYMLPMSPHSFIPKKLGAATARDTALKLGYASFYRLPALVISRVPGNADIYLKREQKGPPTFLIQ